MKKFISLFLIITVLLSCNGNSKSSEVSSASVQQASQEQAAATTKKTDFPLFANYDCKTCHMADEKLAGPSYKEIATKYAGADTAVKYLASKIIKGGSGVWGEVPMTAHADMPAEDAEQLASYIMSLK